MKPPKVTLGKFGIRSLRAIVQGDAFTDYVLIDARLQAEHDVNGLNNPPPETIQRERLTPVAWEAMSEIARAHLIRNLLIRLVTHEVDEWLRVDGERVVEPHPENVAKIVGVKP
jgi:hypothetical protein